MKKLIVAIAVIAVISGGARGVLAGYMPGGECGPPPEAGMNPGGFLPRMAKVLKLTDDQQSQIKVILDAEREQIRPFLDKMHEGRKLLIAAGETTFDEASVRSTASAISQIETELTVIRVRTQSQIYALLTAEQRELAKNLRPDMEQRPGHPPALR